AAGATLRGIASRASFRREGGLEKLMIAIFRANPNAFEGNINRLRRGVEVTIHSSSEVSKISAADASHEFFLQMEAWHARGKLPGPAKAAERAAAAGAPVRGRGSTVATSEDAALDRRVQVLQEGFNELQGALHREQD